MKKLYIKINGSQTEEMAMKKAEELGYKEDNLKESPWREIIVLSYRWYYFYTDYTEERLKEDWFEELIIKEEFTRWELVEVRDYDRDEWERGIYLTTIEWAWNPYFTVSWGDEESFENWKEFEPIEWRQIRKIKKKKETITIWKHTYNKEEFENAVKDLKTNK